MISLVVNSGWHSVSAYPVTISVPSGAQIGDLLVGVIAAAPGPPPEGLFYGFNGSAGYSLQVSGDNLWIVTRFATGSDPGVDLPPYDTDPYGAPANTAAGIIYVFRGVGADFGISAVGASYDGGPSVDSIFPSIAGGDTYSVTASSGTDPGSKSVTSNPYSLGELSDYWSSYPQDLRAILYGGNISSGDGSSSSVTIDVTGSANLWNTGGIAFRNYDTRSLSASLTQAGNSASSTATVAWLDRVLSLGTLFQPKYQANNTASSTATVSSMPVYLSLSGTQSSNSISGYATVIYNVRNVSLNAVQQSDSIASEAGFYAVLGGSLLQQDNQVSGNIASQLAADLSMIQQDNIMYAESAVHIVLDFNATQEGNAIDAIVNGKLLFASIVCGDDSTASSATVSVSADLDATQDANYVTGDAKHFWFPPTTEAPSWGNRPEQNSIWVKVPKQEVF